VSLHVRLEKLYLAALGAALMCMILKWTKGLDTNPEFWFATLVWISAYFAKSWLEKKAEAQVNG
jgi:hypothetical protein